MRVDENISVFHDAINQNIIRWMWV